MRILGQTAESILNTPVTYFDLLIVIGSGLLISYIIYRVYKRDESDWNGIPQR